MSEPINIRKMFEGCHKWYAFDRFKEEGITEEQVAQEAGIDAAADYGNYLTTGIV